MRPAWILAHGLGGRADLPLPAWMFGYGAAAALLVSFAALGLFWPTPRLEDGTREWVLAGSSAWPVRVLAAVARLGGLVAFAVVMVAAAIGDNSSRTNLAPVAVFIAFWVGLAFVSGLVGDVWQVLSPFDTLAAIGQRLRGRPAEAGPASPGDASGPGTTAGPVSPDDDGSAAGGSEGEDVDDDGYDDDGYEDEDGGDEPAGRDWGYWPAAAGILVFVWVELVYPQRAEPRTLFVLMAAYSVAVLVGAVRWGRDWLREGEAFGALFGVLGHAAPVHRGDDGRLRVRPPFAGLARMEWRPGLEALVLIALGSTSFDGLSRTRFWLRLTGDLSGGPAQLASTAGLLWGITTVTIAYVGAMRVAAHLVDGRYSAEELRASFIHSLVPIVLAYAVAHYFSYFVLEGQATVSLVSDPLGRGWDLFGTASRVVDYTFVSTRTVSYVQCGSIVVGHVAGVVIAHDRALALFDKRAAARSQYPLLAAMVLFTVGGLYLLLGG